MSSKHLEILIDEFNKLPGIGRKSATRLAFYVLNTPEKEIETFIQALKDSKTLVKKCSVCGNYSEEDICDICSNINRDHETICVVEDSRDIVTLEKTGKFNGVYHILNGKIAPLDGITPDKLNIKSLLERVSKENIKEIIFALSSDLEGETTVMYLTKLLKPFGVVVSKLASGIPMGGNIEFADNATISKALEGREIL
ncbi:recombination mediator RecR [Fusobacterium perfoetens]|uniref:recombination mediator RecR n=1 Tax=Fusobacterium perfoetens TaxID=852 RepID=UPI000480BFD3|nr:recombination mediator RecR [Fusobacterium perfoetens]MCI6152471.1 recombination mediator RecR [Fusobacterium perfoetens]MDY3238212.1 recombination mediator RecR [Fusobacterium perfoetens]